MKLRLQDNSIRLRLTRSEVERLAADGRVENSVRLGALPADVLTYALEASPSSKEICVSRAPNEICVSLPQKLAWAWATTEQVSIEHLRVISSNVVLRILIEKDFRCVHRDVASSEENMGDLYPNPKDAESVPD